MDTNAPSAVTSARQFSLRSRVTLSIIILTALMQLALGIVIALYQRSSTERLFNTRIAVRLDDIAKRIEALDQPLTDEILRTIERDAIRFVLFEQVSLAVYQSDGTLVSASRESPPMPAALVAEVLATGQSRYLAPSEPLVFSAGQSPMPARFGLRPVALNGGRGVLVLGAGDRYAQDFIASTRELLVGVIFGSLIATIVATWLIVGRVLQPLMELGSLATRLQPDQLERNDRLPGDRIEELGSLRTELASARERLRIAFSAQDRFISNVSHELKTPIAILLTAAQTADPATLGPGGQELARSVTDEMRRLGSMVESFLLLTRVRAGKSALVDRRFPILEPVIEALSHCESLAVQHRVTLVPTVDERVSLEDELVGDPTLVRVMVEGLLRNAIRFSPPGNEVTMRVEPEDPDAVSIAIRDHGPGIPEEIKDSLFDRFVQARSESDRGRGTGLGLTIAQGIAELHGGKIRYANERPRGCTFFVRLPMTKRPITERLGGAE